MIIQCEQGSEEWLSLRKKKITATDAAIILEMNPWKTPYELLVDKWGTKPAEPPNAAMLKGQQLEPIARDLFNKEYSLNVEPAVLIHDKYEWMMASLDGHHVGVVVEIKCGGKKLHEGVKNGFIPDYYQCQMQHQMAVGDVEWMFFCSYFQEELITIKYYRDEDFIESMISKEYEFFRMMRINGA